MEEGSLDPAPVWTDLKSFDGTDWRGAVDLIAAGYPCQPFSHAGKRKGADDPRHLWPDVARVIRETQPRALVLENVQGHITKGLQEVLEEIAELGFDAEWGVYSAAQAGLPHRRNRLFILAYSRSGGLEVLRGSGLLDGVRAAQRDDPDGCHESVADSDSGFDELRREPRELSEPSSCLEGKGVPQLYTADGQSQEFRPPGPEDDWSDVPEHLWPATEPAVCGVPDGLSNRVDRLRALGNAVVPQQAELAIKDLLRRIDDRKDPE